MIFYSSVLTHQNHVTHFDFSPENKIRVQHQKGLQVEPEPCLLDLCDFRQSPPLTKLAALVFFFCKMGLITSPDNFAGDVIMVRIKENNDHKEL